MDVPFTISLEVVERGYGDNTPLLGVSRYPVRVTHRHHVRDIYQAVWYNSPDFRLKPVFLRITDLNEQTVNDLQICDLLNTSDTPQAEVTGFKLIIDYTLFDSPSIPRRDPVEELFDIVIEWNDTRGRTNNIRIRESLACTVGVLKDYVAEERNKTIPEGPMVDGSYFSLRYWADDDVLEDNSMKMSDVLKLDVTPLGPVLLELAYNMDRIKGLNPPQPPSTRFFVKVNSTVPSLQEERSLFEANSRTTIRDFIDILIERADANSVSRTFFDQVKLYHDSELLSQRDFLDSTLYEQLNLSEDILAQRRNVVAVDLVVHQHLSGVEGGILSREFLNDLRSNSRFQFLPTVRDELVQAPREDRQQSFDLAPIQPTVIRMENGVEWHLTGETYEMVQASSLTRFDSGPRQLLVSQADLATEEFEFSLTLPGSTEPLVVVLNSLQCIVVNQGNHQPYILLSPSASAKLNAAFRYSDGSPCIQQVQIHLYDPEPPRAPATPAFHGNEAAPAANPIVDAEQQDFNNAINNDIPNDPPRRNVQAQQVPVHLLSLLVVILTRGWNFLVNHLAAFTILLAKISFFIFATGLASFFLNELSSILWVVLEGALMHIFIVNDWRTSHYITDVLLAPGRGLPWSQYYTTPLKILSKALLVTGLTRRIVVHIFKEETLAYSVARKRSYVIEAQELTGQVLLLTKLGHLVNETCKLTILFFITLVPSLAKEAQERLDSWQSSEISDLRKDIERLYTESQQLTQQAQIYDLPLTVDFNIEEVRNFTAGPEENAPEAEHNNNEIDEKQFLVSHYLQLYIQVHKAKKAIEKVDLAAISQRDANDDLASTEEQNMTPNVPEQIDLPETVRDSQVTTTTGSRTHSEQDL